MGFDNDLGRNEDNYSKTEKANKSDWTKEDYHRYSLWVYRHIAEDCSLKPNKRKLGEIFKRKSKF